MTIYLNILIFFICSTTKIWGVGHGEMNWSDIKRFTLIHSPKIQLLERKYNGKKFSDIGIIRENKMGIELTFSKEQLVGAKKESQQEAGIAVDFHTGTEVITSIGQNTDENGNKNKFLSGKIEQNLTSLYRPSEMSFKKSQGLINKISRIHEWQKEIEEFFEKVEKAWFDVSVVNKSVKLMEKQFKISTKILAEKSTLYQKGSIAEENYLRYRLAESWYRQRLHASKSVLSQSLIKLSNLMGKPINGIREETGLTFREHESITVADVLADIRLFNPDYKLLELKVESFELEVLHENHKSLPSLKIGYERKKEYDEVGIQKDGTKDFGTLSASITWVPQFPNYSYKAAIYSKSSSTLEKELLLKNRAMEIERVLMNLKALVGEIKTLRERHNLSRKTLEITNKMHSRGLIQFEKVFDLQKDMDEISVDIHRKSLEYRMNLSALGRMKAVLSRGLVAQKL